MRPITQSAFEIAGNIIDPGTMKNINIPIPGLYTHNEMTIPIHVINGRQKGPALFVCAAIHGDEILGVEIIRRIIKLKKIQRLKGTLVAIPVVNIFGFINQSRYLPDRRDLNRCFPGSEKGSLTSRLADIFLEEVVSRCSHGIDLHTGSNHRKNLPQIRAYLDNPETRKMANAFKAPVIIHSNTLDRSLRQAVHEKGIPILLYEAGEALRFEELPIRAGVRGVLSVMSHLGMLPLKGLGRSKVEPMISKKTTWIRAPISGICKPKVPLGHSVSKGEKIGEIVDPFGNYEKSIISKIKGVIIGQLNLPLVYEGDAIFHIAHFEDPETIEPTMEEFEQEMEKTF